MLRRKLNPRHQLLLAVLLTASPQLALPQTPALNQLQSQPGLAAKTNLDSCHVREVTTLPGSHHFGSDFIVAMATDPDPRARNSAAVWALTADLSDTIPAEDRAFYLSKSNDGGKTWTQVARLDSTYFDAEIGEGLRNNLSVAPGGGDFVITTQRGAFQVLPRSGASGSVIKYIPGPRIPSPIPERSLPKNEGDPVMAGVVRIAADGKHMLVGYGYFDGEPQLFRYHRDTKGSWIEDKPVPNFPTDLDILSMEFDNPRSLNPRLLYVGTGDQAYLLNLRTMKWARITGVGPDSAIHGMSIVGGPHLAACWGVYNPLNAAAVERVTDARFLLHRNEDEVGPNIRAYGIEVDPARPDREVLTAITGVYTSQDSGRTWRRLNDLPDGEFRSAHFNPDGSVILSGLPGTFLANPFSNTCSPQLKTR